MDSIYHPHREILRIQPVLSALADPSRLRMVQELLQAGEIPSTGFQSTKAFARGSVAHHLKILRLAGITETRIVANKRLVSLRRRDLEARWPGLLDAALRDFPTIKPSTAA